MARGQLFLSLFKQDAPPVKGVPSPNLPTQASQPTQHAPRAHQPGALTSSDIEHSGTRKPRPAKRCMLRGLLVRLGDFGGCLGPIITEISQIQCRASNVGASEHPRRHARLRRTYLSGYLELQDPLKSMRALGVIW